MGPESTSIWASRSLARRNFVIMLASYFLGLMFSNLWFDDDGNHSIFVFLLILLAACMLMLFFAAPAFSSTSEETVESVFNFLVSTTSILACFYFLTISSTLFFEWDPAGTSGTTDNMVRYRLMQGQVPPGLQLAFTLPLQTIPMGMDISIAKRVTVANLFIVVLMLYFIHAVQISGQHFSQTFDEDSRHKIFVHDFLSTSYAAGVAYFSLAPGLQITDEYNRILRDGRLADSVLNHLLKNSIAGASCIIEMEMEDSPPTRDTKRLAQALKQLHSTMEWCVSRQVMMDLASANYKTSFSECHIGQLLSRLTTNSSVGGASFAVTNKTPTSRAIQFDVHVAEIALANVLSNACEHGDTSEAIDFSVNLIEGVPASTLEFRVENFVPAHNSVTNEMLQETKKEAMERVRGVGVASTRKNLSTRRTSSNSTNSGLYHVALACRGAAGSFDITVGSKNERKTVVLVLTVPAKALNGTKGLGNDEDATTLRASSSPSLEPPEQSQSIPEGFKICAIDDSKIICKGYEKLVLPKLKADVARSHVECPSSSASVDAFVNVVMGSADGSSNAQQGGEKLPRTSREGQADIVILDQHIIVKGADSEAHTVYGSDVAQQLRDQKFEGLVLIRSANASALDAASYMSSGAVDACIGKDCSNSEVVNAICRAYHKKRGLPAPLKRGASRTRINLELARRKAESTEERPLLHFLPKPP